MFIHDEFLVRGTVLNADFFTFQLVDAGVFTLLAHKQRRVVVVRGGEQHLFFTLWGDVHTGHYRVKTTEFKAWDQAVEGLIGEGTSSVNLFTQRVCQINVKTYDLVIRIDRFKRRIRRFGGETNGLGCGSGKTKTCD